MLSRKNVKTKDWSSRIFMNDIDAQNNQIVFRVFGSHILHKCP